MRPHLRYLPAVVWAGAVFAASVLDPPSSGPVAFGPLGLVPLDKWLHALAYGGLAGLLAFARRAATPRALLVVALAAAAYGLGIEAVQAFLPLRSFDLADAAANGTGALLGAVGWRALAAPALDRVRA